MVECKVNLTPTGSPAAGLKGRKRLLPPPFASRLLATKANPVGGAGKGRWEIYCGASAPLFYFGKRQVV